jgi:hypothetical protein
VCALLVVGAVVIVLDGVVVGDEVVVLTQPGMGVQSQVQFFIGQLLFDGNRTADMLIYYSIKMKVSLYVKM